jgi:sortase (surface protein transpeptidase)
VGNASRTEFLRLAAAAGAVVVAMAGVLTGVGLILANSGAKGSVTSSNATSVPTTAKQASQGNAAVTAGSGSAVVAVGALPASAPHSLTIPAIGLTTGPIIELGQTPYGAMEVPGNADAVGWFSHSRPPGERGVAVIAGHILFAHERGAFYDLGGLAPGDVVDITRQDGITAQFTVYRIETRAAPAIGQVQSEVSTEVPELRLVTGGARFDTLPGERIEELVVFARLTGTA